MIRALRKATPDMISDTTPSGKASASSVFSTSGAYFAYRAFDGKITNTGSYDSWVTASGTLTGWLQYEFPTQKCIIKYSLIHGYNSTNTAPRDWTIEASNDGVTWVILDTRTNVTDWVLWSKKEFVLSNTNHFLMYRINITKNNGSTSYVGVQEFEMFESNFEGSYLIKHDNKYYATSNSPNLIPIMTSNVSPSGSASASSIANSSHDAWKAFSYFIHTSKYQECWESSGRIPSWLCYEFQTAITVDSYSVQTIDSIADLNRSPRTWAFEGSNDGVSWIVLDKQHNQINWKQNETRYYTNLTSQQKFKKYRINITDNNGGDHMLVRRLEMYQNILHIIDGSKTTNIDQNHFIQYGMDNKILFPLNQSFDTHFIVAQNRSPLGNGQLFKQKIETSKASIHFVDIKSEHQLNLKCLVKNKNAAYSFDFNHFIWNKVTELEPTDQHYLNYGMDNISLISQAFWSAFEGDIELCVYTHDLSASEIIMKVNSDDLSFTDKHADTFEVLYYTLNQSIQNADLYIHSNYCPLDELGGDIEVVTWTRETNRTISDHIRADYKGHYSEGDMYSTKIELHKGNGTKAITGGQ
ncbi:discoidin domain-containing protein [Paenibacillus sp. ACRRX]|uniref:discoidin domain-containing protein n=1 Tax=Paenibacillus sp. ACRRX TaxID=2918206 RepID=UPI001EF5781E|nr:discoidin domain-containing protein [Paenibacillus sp. ACRRX]MCG7406373.1 discoidin domain-containing protein [Paenibacillus sp. ACRRX]